ncbi:hypothetical protein OAH18_00065 [bacterium]|nr:hypothetical protein [bacterium]
MCQLPFLKQLVVVGFLVGLSGCALFTKPDDSSSDPSRETVGRLPDRITRDTIQLEVLLLDRPAKDPLLGRILWDDVDEIGAVELDVRERLNANGFRIGVAGTSIPQALQTIIESSRKGLTFLPEDDRRLSSQAPINLVAGTDTLVQTAMAENRLILIEGNDELGDYENAMCAFRIKANRLQDGWARLEFTPEIHHGENALRHHANEVGWEMRASQDVEPLYEQRFEIMLNVGETAVISCGSPKDDSPGQHFFKTNKGEQRLMIVRLTELGSVEGVSQRVGR